LASERRKTPDIHEASTLLEYQAQREAREGTSEKLNLTPAYQRRRKPRWEAKQTRERRLLTRRQRVETGLPAVNLGLL
jgi:hypothetical protein